jgi:uncharacterized protein with NRDE domain
MCTIVLLRRPGHRWPLILAANRDEMAERPWAPPGRHWPDREEVVAGLDRLAGGSWLGINDHGVVAGVLNREGSLGPETGKRSRGELVLEALDHAEAAEAAQALSRLDPRSYRSFNLIVADNSNAFWLRHRGGANAAIEVFPVPPGLSMVTALDRNDPKSARIRAYLPRFERAAAPDPDTGSPSAWADWERLLAARVSEAAGPDLGEGGPMGAMNIVTEQGFGTVSSSILALPAPGTPPKRPVWRFAAGRPGEAPYQPVSL